MQPRKRTAASALDRVGSEEEKDDDSIIDATNASAFMDELVAAVGENARARQAHAEEPALFFASEEALFALIERLATTVEDVALFEENGPFIAAAVSLVLHPNRDISSATIAFFRDASATLEDDRGGDEAVAEEDSARPFLEGAIQSGLAEDLLEHALLWAGSVVARGGAAESPVIDAVGRASTFAAMQVIENIVSFGRELAIGPRGIQEHVLVEGWCAFLLNVLESLKGVETIQAYAAELLCALATSIDGVRAYLGRPSAMALLLRTLYPFVGSDSDAGSPAKASGCDNIELMQNTTDAICSALVEASEAAIEAFIEGDGISQALLMIARASAGSSAMEARASAVKMLAFAIVTPRSCRTLIEDSNGLRYIFPLFMAITGRRRRDDALVGGEHVCALLASLQRHTAPQAHGDALLNPSPSYDRIMGKFAEKSYEKSHHLAKVILAAKRRDDRVGEELSASLSEETGEQLYRARMAAGLSLLLQASLIVLYIAAAPHASDNPLFGNDSQVLDIAVAIVSEHRLGLDDEEEGDYMRHLEALIENACTLKGCQEQSLV